MKIGSGDVDDTNTQYEVPSHTSVVPSKNSSQNPTNISRRKLQVLVGLILLLTACFLAALCMAIFALIKPQDGEREASATESREKITQELDEMKTKTRNMEKQLLLLQDGEREASATESREKITQALDEMKTKTRNMEKQLLLLQDMNDGPKAAFQATSISKDKVQPDEVIVFEDVILNDGNHYDPQTGIYTASVNGTYLFSANICTYRDHWFQVQIRAGNAIVATVSSYGSQGGACSSATGLAKLTIGDKAMVECTFYTDGGSYQDTRRHPTFWGMFLY